VILQRLIEIGVDFSQGYHIHKPMKLDEQAFSQLLNNMAQITPCQFGELLILYSTALVLA